MLSWGWNLIWNTLAGILEAVIIAVATWLWRGRRRGKNIEGLVLQLGRDSDEGDRTSAVKQLLKMGNSVIQPLIEAACNPEDGVLRENAAKVLSQIGPAAIRPIVAYRATSNSSPAVSAIDKVLEGTKSEAEIKIVVELLYHHNWRIQRDAAELLGKIGSSQAAVPLKNLCMADGTSMEVRAQCASSLGNFKGPEVAKFLVTLLDSSESRNSFAVRSAAAEALGKVGEPSAVDPL